MPVADLPQQAQSRRGGGQQTGRRQAADRPSSRGQQMLDLQAEPGGRVRPHIGGCQQRHDADYDR